MRLTRHNGRAGKNGVYNPKHNDRRFDVKNSEHIDAERVSQNIYWDCIHGYRTINDQRDPDEALETFSEIERLFYEQRYAGFVEGQNARNAKTRHVERNRTAEQILQNKKTCPEETIYQIGTMDEHISEEVLLSIVTDFMSEMDQRFGSNVHILDWALHMDESTPHIHERHVFDAENQYGEVAPQQEKALEALGFELPDPTKKPGKYNNRKMVFDATCRTLLFDIAEQHGLHLTEETEYGGRKYLEKQDFILMQQKKKLEQGEVRLDAQQTQITENANQLEEQKNEITENADAIAEQEEHLEELSMKIEDVDSLIEEVSAAAYDKAVDAVADMARKEVLDASVEQIDNYVGWLGKPERKADAKIRNYAISQLGKLREMVTSAVAKLSPNLAQLLKQTEVKQPAVQDIGKKVKPSVMAMLRQKKEESSRQSEEQKRQANRKQNMEL